MNGLMGIVADAVLEELKKRLDSSCISFADEDSDDFRENVAMCDETVLEEYLETGEVPACKVADMIAERKVFPCYFGSALKMQGVQDFLTGTG